MGLCGLHSNVAMYKIAIFILSLFTFAAHALAQVEITYSEITESSNIKMGNTDTFSILSNEELTTTLPTKAILVNVADTLTQTPLRYGLIDLSFLVEYVSSLKEYMAIYLVENKNTEMECMEKLNKALSETEKQNIVKEAQNKISSNKLKALSEAYEFCIPCAVELGFIPLDKSLSFVGKVAEEPDITWELGNKLERMNLEPYSKALPKQVDLKIGIVNVDLINNRLNHPDVNDIIAAYPNKYDSYKLDLMTNAEKINQEIWEKILSGVQTKSQAMGYDGVIIINKSSYIPLAITENMDDLTYPILMDVLPSLEGDHNRFIKLIDEYMK